MLIYSIIQFDATPEQQLQNKSQKISTKKATSKVNSLSYLKPEKMSRFTVQIKTLKSYRKKLY